MATDWVARTLAGCSALVAVSSFIWAVVSWRLSGPSLRLHMVVDDYNLIIRVFNRGRGSDSIEHLVLGGTKHGLGGEDLSRTLGLPLTIAPGESFSRRVRLASLPVSEVKRLRSGWEVVWLLCGSMRLLRGEVIPVSNPARVGLWVLVPRRAKLLRYVPWLGAVFVFASAQPGPVAFGISLSMFAAVGIVVLAHFLFGQQKVSSRARWVGVVWTAMSLASLVVHQHSDDVGTVTGVTAVALMAAFLVAQAFASPGFMASLLSSESWTRWRRLVGARLIRGR